MEKVFKAVVYRRLAFVDAALASQDKYNNALQKEIGHRIISLFWMVWLRNRSQLKSACTYAI